MILYFSGGSDIVEVSLPAPAIMLSYYCHAGGDPKVKTINPIGRFKRIMRIRCRAKNKPIPLIAKKGKKKCKKQSRSKE